MHFRLTLGVRIERFDNTLDYTEAFDFLKNFYGEENAESIDESLSHSLKHRKILLSQIRNSHKRLANSLGEIMDFPRQVVVALAHSIRYCLSFGLSDAFRRRSFFGSFLTRSHMLLNANTLANLLARFPFAWSAYS